MNLYLDSGYVNFPAILGRGFTWNWLTGGRGIGKTYGILEYVLYNSKEPFMYLRRTAKQYNAIKSKDFSPLNPVAKEHGDNYIYEDVSHEDLTRVYRECGEDKEIVGYFSALSTFYNIRGFDASTIKYLIYDEFIPEAHARPIRKEDFALANIYETINRNRELKGEAPLIFIGLSNSDAMANPYFIGYNLMKYYGRMYESGNEYTELPDRSTLLINFKKSPISEAKNETSLYKMVGEDSEYSKMAIKNEFNSDDFAYIKSYNLKSFSPLVSIGNIGIFTNNQSNIIYVSSTIPKSVRHFQPFGIEQKEFNNKYRFLKIAYLNGKCRFESYTEKVAFEAFCNFTQR